MATLDERKSRIRATRPQRQRRESYAEFNQRMAPVRNHTVNVLLTFAGILIAALFLIILVIMVVNGVY